MSHVIMCDSSELKTDSVGWFRIKFMHIEIPYLDFLGGNTNCVMMHRVGDELHIIVKFTFVSER